MGWQLNPAAIPILLTTVPLGYCLYLAWRGRANLPTRLFLVMNAATMWLLVLTSARLLSTNANFMLWTAKLEFPLNLFAAAFWLLFILAYAGHERLVTAKSVVALLTFPCLYALLVWTNDRHHLHWAYTGVSQTQELIIFVYAYRYSAPFLCLILYTYSLMVISTAVTIRAFIQANAVFRRQTGVLMVAALLPWLATAVDLIGFKPIPSVHVSTLLIPVSMSLLAWGLFRQRLLDLTPAAHAMILRGMSDAVLVLDPQNRIIEANLAAEQLVGSEVYELIGRPVREVFANVSEVLKGFLHVQEAEEEIAVEQNGNVRHFDVRISPLHDQRQEYRGRVVLIRDITEHIRAKEQAVQLALEQQRARLLHEFIDVTSHDLNTPLTTLRISTDLLRVYTDRLPAQLVKLRTYTTNRVLDDALMSLEKLSNSIAANGDRINESTLRLQSLVSEILDMVRLDKQMQLHLTAADLNQVSQQAFAEATEVTGDKNLRFEFHPQPSLPPVLIDSAELGRAIKQIVRNATTHTPAGGTVTLRILADAEWVAIEVSDSGHGIPENDLPHIFERFYRVDRSRNAQTGGVGLGLAISKKIVEAHGGKVEVESRFGVGSTFRICLPLKPHEPALNHRQYVRM